MDGDARRSLFRELFNFVRSCEVKTFALVFDKKTIAGHDALVSAMAKAVGSLIRDNLSYFQSQDRLVIYYDNGQREITNLVNSVFNALLSNVEVKRVVAADYSLFQAADLCCTLELLRTKLYTGALSKSEKNFFETKNSSGERALKKLYLNAFDRMRFPA